MLLFLNETNGRSLRCTINHIPSQAPFIMFEKSAFWFDKNVEEQPKPDLNSLQHTEAPSPLANGLNWGNTQAIYKIEIDTTLHLMHKQVSNSQSENTWKISQSPDGALQIDVLDRKVLKMDAQMRPLMEIIEKINHTTDRLALTLREDLTVDEVTNTASILKRWEQIKFEQLRVHELQDPHFVNIVNAYNDEFENLAHSIHINILYQLFFYPKGKIQYPVTTSQLVSENNKTISQLLPQQFVYYNLLYASSIEDDKIRIDCFAEAPVNWLKQNIKEDYLKNYAGYLGDDFDFDFKIEARYTHRLDGTLEQAIIYIKEQANEQLFCINQYRFTLIEQAANGEVI